jgi:hypothetical protein
MSPSRSQKVGDTHGPEFTGELRRERALLFPGRASAVCLSPEKMAMREIELTAWGPHVIDAKRDEKKVARE